MHGKLDAALAPWLTHVVEAMGVAGKGDIPGPRPGPLRFPERAVLTVLVLGASLVFFLHLFSSSNLRGRGNASRDSSWCEMFWLFVPYTSGYMVAIIIRGASDFTFFDRYLLSLQALAIAFLLRYYQTFVEPDGGRPHLRLRIGDLPMASTLALLAFAVYGIAGIHDWFALNRARLDAANEIRRKGVPRTAISAGFEYDAWTQIETAGYINDSRIQNPAGAWHHVTGATVPSECSTWFPSDLIPAVVPRYILVFEPRLCFAPSEFQPVEYTAWLPPLHRRIYIQQVAN